MLIVQQEKKKKEHCRSLYQLTAVG